MADAPPPRSPNNKWHGRAPDPAYQPPKSKRGRQIYWLSALMLALLGTVAAIVFYPNTMSPVRLFTMTVREYQSPFLPPNAFAKQDSELLAKHFENRTEDFYDNQSRNTFEKFLTRLENSGKGPVVVQFGALGRVEKHRVPGEKFDRDRVVLYLVDADLEQNSRGVPLQEILDRIKKGASSGDRLLLLDVARPAADAHLGVLSDDLAAAVEKELEQEDELPFFVLTACSAGQMSHVSEELGASVFAYHVDLALRGFAEQTKDRRISVEELANFTKKHVDRWVWHNRGSRQTPRLFGKLKDFPIKQLESGAAEFPEPPGEKKYASWLKDGWKERDDLYQSGAYRGAPWAFRKLELALARTEKRWRWGDDDDGRLKRSMENSIRDFKDEILKSRDRGPAQTFSVAEVRDEKSDSLAKEYQNRLDRYLIKIVDPKMKVEEGDKARIEEAKKSKMELIEELKKLPFDTAAAIIVAAAERPPNLTAGRIFALVELLGAMRENLTADRRLVEVIYLERLKELAERVIEIADWQGAVAHQALAVELQAAEVLADLNRTPSGFDPWNKGLVLRGDAQRRIGDKDLFAGIDFSWRDAQAAFQTAEPIFRAVPRRLNVLRSMQKHRDQAFVHLPGWGPYLIALPRVDRQEWDTWNEGLPAARNLADALERKDPSTLDSEPNSLSQWQIFAGRWQRLIDSRIQRLKGLVEDGKFPEYLEWHALLESSRLAADQREMAWSSARALGLQMIQKMPKLGTADNDLIVPGDDPTARQEQDRAKRRAKQVTDFLDLAGYTGPLKSDESEAARLQDTLIHGVPKEFLELIRSKAPMASRLTKADRLGRVFPNDVLRRLSGADTVPGFLNPAKELHRVDQGVFWSYLRERYNADADSLKAQKGRHEHESFFREASATFPALTP